MIAASIRLYTSEVTGFVQRWLAEPPPANSPWRTVKTAMVVNNMDDNITTLVAKMDELKAIGIKAIPGMMLTYRTELGLGDWLSRSFWDWRAAQLLAIRKALDYQDEIAIHFDTENFGGTGAELTPEVIAMHGGHAKLLDAIKPFLDVFDGGRKWYAWICPAAPNDVMIQLILSRVQRGKLLDEESFSQPIHYLTQTPANFLTLVKYIHKHRADTLEAMQPFCADLTWVPGFKQHIFQAWSNRYWREAFALMGVDEFWEYNDDKDAARAGWRPGAEWSAGLKRSSLNDCRFFPLYGPANRDEWNYRGVFQSSSNTEAGRNPWVDDCHWPGGDRSLMLDNACHVAQSFTLALDLYVAPNAAKHQGICGVWLPDNGGGHKEWLLRLTEGKLFLDYSQGDKTVACGTVVLGWQRMLVRWDVQAKRFTINGTELPCTPDSAPAQPLRLGVGQILDGGSRVIIHANELCFKNVHVWNRGLTAIELTKAASAANYPY